MRGLGRGEGVRGGGGEALVAAAEEGEGVALVGEEAEGLLVAVGSLGLDKLGIPGQSEPLKVVFNPARVLGA